MDTVTDIVARIALTIPEKPTSGDTLLALSRVAEAAAIAYYHRGLEEGRKEVVKDIDNFHRDMAHV